MSDLASQARARADVWADINERETPTSTLLRSLADLCDTYREALEQIAMTRCGIYGHAVAQSCGSPDRARLALATGDQARVVEAEEGE